MNNLYCDNLHNYTRIKSKVVTIGDTPLGGNNPIRVQSMTNTNTQDVVATVEQSIRMIDAGSEYVRITVPTLEEVDCIKEIKKQLNNKGFKTPIIADVHFNPKVAEESARFCEKVRINPGNYVDKKAFKEQSYTEAEYKYELERIQERLAPLLKICKENGTAIRIGTNHGSLSDRIISQYGDTPKGMVESAIEFVKICEDFGFYNIVLSMKSSNVRIMVQAYRLLVDRMMAENMNYPLHLGVTEAGYGENGRIKSYTGIATLLNDGIGDTIRVSLTENPEDELKPALMLSNYFNKKDSKNEIINNNLSYNPFEYNRRKSYNINNIGSSFPPVVIAQTENNDKKNIESIDLVADFFVKDQVIISSNDVNLTLRKLTNTIITDVNSNYYINLSSDELNSEIINVLKQYKNIVIIIQHKAKFLNHTRSLINQIAHLSIENPIIIAADYGDIVYDELLFFASSELGALLIDGLIDGIWIKSTNKSISKEKIVQISFNILQATRARIYSAEFISCPTCGRTQYDLTKVLEKLEPLKKHLNGLKIAVMGCVVNGPGEMADADYGYVGAGNAKVNLYKGKTLVIKLVEESEAVNELIAMIKSNGDWKE